jgi:putative hydrolase of the HAD superfamily
MTGKNIDGKDIDRGFHDWLIPVEQEKLDYILELRKKYKVLLLSNTNDISMSWARSEEFVPGGKPFEYYFDELYLSYKLGCVKPEPEIFQMVINLAGINPAETLYIDDGESNIAAGKSYGVQDIFVRQRKHFC